MSRYFKNLAKSVSRLYYGEVNPAAVGSKVENFADYLGDKKYKDDDLDSKSHDFARKPSSGHKGHNKKPVYKSEEIIEEVEEVRVYEERRESVNVETTASIPFMVKIFV